MQGNKMKISRKKLRKIINEFLDTTRPMVDQPIPDLKDLTSTSVYDQLTNSERAAFVSAMGIAGDAGITGTSQELNEGDVISFRQRQRELPDLDGYVTPYELRDADLAPVHHLPPTPEEEENIQRKLTTARLSNLPDDDDLDAMIELLEQRYEKEKREEEAYQKRAADLATQGVETLPFRRSKFMQDAESDDY